MQSTIREENARVRKFSFPETLIPENLFGKNIFQVILPEIKSTSNFPKNFSKSFKLKYDFRAKKFLASFYLVFALLKKLTGFANDDCNILKVLESKMICFLTFQI